MMTGNYDQDFYHLPSKIDSLRLSSTFYDQPIPEIIYAKVTSVAWSPGTFVSSSL